MGYGPNALPFVYLYYACMCKWRGTRERVGSLFPSPLEECEVHPNVYISGEKKTTQLAPHHVTITAIYYILFLLRVNPTLSFLPTLTPFVLFLYPKACGGEVQ